MVLGLSTKTSKCCATDPRRYLKKQRSRRTQFTAVRRRKVLSRHRCDEKSTQYGMATELPRYPKKNLMAARPDTVARSSPTSRRECSRSVLSATKCTSKITRKRAGKRLVTSNRQPRVARRILHLHLRGTSHIVNQ